VRALTRSGFGVRTCETLAEGRVHFAQQAVVITHANGDTAELQGFVNFVRQASGTSQPYILAVGEADSPSGISQNSLGLDAFFPVPLAQGPLADQLQDVAQRLTHNQTTTPNGAAVVPAAAAATPAPTATAAAPRSAPVPAMLGHFAPVLLDHLPQALAMFDTDMRYVAANRPFTAAFGLDNREILGRSHYELFPDFHANWRVLFDRALQGEPGRIEEDFFQRADGTSDWVRWEVRPWHESDGTIGGLILSQEIITAQKREERRRTFDRNLTSSLFESQSLPVLLVGLDGRILRSSAAARASLGLQPTADGRLPFWEVYPDRAAEEIEKSRFASLTPLNSATPLGDYSPADILIPGTPTQRLHWSPSPHRNAAGLTQAVLLTGSLTPEPAATTAQNNAPSAAANNAPAPAPAPTLALANDLTRHVPFGLVLLDREGIVIAANDAVGLLLGRALTAGASFEPWLTESSPEEALRDPVVREWRDTVWRRQMNRTFSLISADGLIKEIELRPRLLPDGHLLLILTDVTESRRAEDALRTSEAKYRGLFREFPTGIVLADRTGALVEGNPALEKLSGYSRVELRRLRLSHLVEMAPEQESVGTDGRAAFLLTRNGSRLPISLSHGPIRNPAGDTLLQACFLLPRTVAAAAAPAVAAAPETAPEEPDTIETSEAPEPLGLHSDTAAWRDLAFANLKTATLVTDLRGRIRAANPAAIRFLATDGDSLEGVALYRLFRPEDPAGFSREVSEQLNARRRWERETVYYDAEGMPVGRCRAEIIPATSDAVPGLLCVIQPVFTMIAASV
jgi:PAS domain S-box-containing protein